MQFPNLGQSRASFFEKRSNRNAQRHAKMNPMPYKHPNVTVEP
jgi:hypothetical protein